MSTLIVIVLCIVGGSSLYCFQLVWAMRWITRDADAHPQIGSAEGTFQPKIVTLPDLGLPLRQPLPAPHEALEAVVAADTEVVDSAAGDSLASVHWRLPGGYS